MGLQGKISDYFRMYGSASRNPSVDTFVTPGFVPLRNRGKTMEQNHFTLDNMENTMNAMMNALNQLDEEQEYKSDDDHQPIVYNDDFEKMRTQRFARYTNSVISKKGDAENVDAEQVKKLNDQRIEYEIILQALNKDNDAMKELISTLQKEKKIKEKQIKKYKQELMIHEGLLDNEKKTNC